LFWRRGLGGLSCWCDGSLVTVWEEADQWVTEAHTCVILEVTQTWLASSPCFEYKCPHDCPRILHGFFASRLIKYWTTLEPPVSTVPLFSVSREHWSSLFSKQLTVLAIITSNKELHPHDIQKAAHVWLGIPYVHILTSGCDLYSSVKQ